MADASQVARIPEEEGDANRVEDRIATQPKFRATLERIERNTRALQVTGGGDTIHKLAVWIVVLALGGVIFAMCVSAH